MKNISKISLSLIFIGSLFFVKCQSKTAQATTYGGAKNGSSGLAPNGKKWNVLFISVDDLNHWVSPLGRNKQVKTPNLDRLANMGMTFTKAYCSAPSCCPSRASLMSGMRPSTTGVYGNFDDWRKAIPDSITLFTHFRRNGYKVIGGGKLYHGGFDRNEEFDFYLKNTRENNMPFAYDGGNFNGVRWAKLKVTDDKLHDNHTAHWAAEELLKTHDDKPIFIGCGFTMPHMAWNVPTKYYDMYPFEKIELPPYKKDDWDDIPSGGRKISGGKDHEALMKTSNPDSVWRRAIQAYQACISFADAQIGIVLDALEKSPEKENTIIVLWGDHGWNLGEKNHWRKFVLWEESARAPLFMVVPNMTKKGSRCERIVDFIHLYPTLADLCGLKIPQHTEGSSLKPLLQNPTTAWDKASVCTMFANNHSIRTEKWRYIRYDDNTEELYDEVADPYEWTNLANDKKYDSVKKELSTHLPKINKPRDIWKSEWKPNDN
jgi:arylsulfatase A-like enzyme